MLYILLLALIFLCMYMNSQESNTNKHTIPENEPEKVVLLGIEDDDLAAYDSSPIPRVPYYTHKDIIGPPKAAVEINCPDCSGKWE